MQKKKGPLARPRLLTSMSVVRRKCLCAALAFAVNALGCAHTLPYSPTAHQRGLLQFDAGQNSPFDARAVALQVTGSGQCRPAGFAKTDGSTKARDEPWARHVCRDCSSNLRDATGRQL
jgi:hypothetical protein